MSKTTSCNGVMPCLVLVVASWCSAAEPTSESSAVETWFQRARTHAAKMAEAARLLGDNGTDDADTARTPLLGLYVRMGRIGDAESLAQAVDYGTSENQASVRIVLAYILAQAGETEAAVRWAESLDTSRVPDPVFPDNTAPSPRERSLLMITTSQCLRHDFDVAEQTIARLRDPGVISAAWRRLAERQARAGKYDEAERRLAKITDADAKEETRKLIEKCRLEGQRDPPQPDAEDYFEGFRSATALFADVAVDGGSLDEREMTVAEMTDPINRTAAWRQLAWESWRAGDEQRCRRAIRNSLASARDIPKELGYQRAANELLLADLYLELAENKAAIELVRAAQNSNSRDQLVQRGLGEFTTAPIAINVLARTAHWDDAVTVAREFGGTGWEALGVCLGETGELARAERTLETIEQESNKAVFCAGVVYGLQNADRRAKP